MTVEEIAAQLSDGAAKAFTVDVSTIINSSREMPLYENPRGRWVAVCLVPMSDGTKQVRGARCQSKAQARRIANRYGGVVRHYRAKNWRLPPPPKVVVHTWVQKFKPLNEITLTYSAPKEVVDAG